MPDNDSRAVKSSIFDGSTRSRGPRVMEAIRLPAPATLLQRQQAPPMTPGPEK